MNPTRFQICYIPRAKVVAAALAQGWVKGGETPMLDVVTNFETFEEVDSDYPTLADALPRAKSLVADERDLFGQVTIEEQEFQLIHPADGIRLWEVVTRYNVDETGVIETIRQDDYA